MKIKITPTIYVAIGISASGKSFWWETAISKKLLPLKKCKRIHCDIIRNDLSGDINDHSKDRLVEKIALSNLQNFLIHNIPIIYYDDLGLDRNLRLKINKLAKDYKYKTTALIFDTALPVCKKRLDNSSKKIPLEILERQLKILQETPVDYDEGWDDILVIK